MRLCKVFEINTLFSSSFYITEIYYCNKQNKISTLIVFKKSRGKGINSIHTKQV